MENEEIMENVDIGLEEYDTSGENDSINSSSNDIDNVTEYDNSDSSDVLSSEPTLEELLKEYFSSQDHEKEEINYIENSREASSESSIDYTQILNDLYDEAAYQTSMQETALQYYEDYQRNNTLSSEVNSISLSNILLLYVGFCILALACINFARRIF